jgi:DNA-binding NarL/FixJ family response regulator
MHPNHWSKVKDVRHTIVIADDLRLVLLALRGELRSSGFEICGEATTGSGALAEVRKCRPELALLDVQMPEGRGDDIARVLSVELPDVKIVLMTAKPDEEGALRAVRSGAVGYVDKMISPRQFVRVLKAVAAGEGAFPRRYFPRLAAELRGDAGRRAATPA